MSPSLIFTPNIYVKVCCNVSYIIKVVFFVHVYRVLHHYLSLHVVQKNLRFECVHILHYTFLLLFMQTSSLSKFEVLGALSKLTNFTLVSRKNIVSNNKWHIVQTSPRYIYVLIWKTPNILRAAYFSDISFGKSRTKPHTYQHICSHVN